MNGYGGKARWEVLEEWLLATDVAARRAAGDDRPEAELVKDSEPRFSFNVHQLAISMRVPVGEASSLINSYLGAQRGARTRTLFVLHRVGRTRNAVWAAGHRTVDLKAFNKTLYGDIRVKVQKAWAPDVARLAALNPRAARRAELTLTAVTDNALALMAAALDTAHEDGDGS